MSHFLLLSFILPLFAAFTTPLICHSDTVVVLVALQRVYVCVCVCVRVWVYVCVRTRMSVLNKCSAGLWCVFICFQRKLLKCVSKIPATAVRQTDTDRHTGGGSLAYAAGE